MKKMRMDTDKVASYLDYFYKKIQKTCELNRAKDKRVELTENLESLRVELDGALTALRLIETRTECETCEW